MDQPASPQPNSVAKEPDTASKPLDEPDQPGKIIVSLLKDYWSKNEGKKKKYTVVFGIVAKKNKTHEALLNAAKTFPDTGNKRKHTHTDSRPFPLLKACRLASWVGPFELATSLTSWVHVGEG